VQQANLGATCRSRIAGPARAPAACVTGTDSIANGAAALLLDEKFIGEMLKEMADNDLATDDIRYWNLHPCMYDLIHISFDDPKIAITAKDEEGNFLHFFLQMRVNFDRLQPVRATPRQIVASVTREANNVKVESKYLS